MVYNSNSELEKQLFCQTQQVATVRGSKHLTDLDKPN